MFLVLEIIKKLIAVGPICLGIFVGIYWMLIGTIITGIIAFFLNSYYTGKFLGYSSWVQLKDIAPSYMFAFVIALSVYFLKYLPISYWIVFPLQIALGVLVFFSVLRFKRFSEFEEVKSVLQPVLNRFHKRCL